jgi:hypothetical protein
LLLDDRVDIGNSYRDLCGSSRHDFHDRELIQIPRIIVIYGAPDKVPEISRRLFSSNCRAFDSAELHSCLGQKIRKKPSFKQNRAVLPVVGLRHDITNMDVVIFMILYDFVL